jgi:hypothetical protein
MVALASAGFRVNSDRGLLLRKAPGLLVRGQSRYCTLRTVDPGPGQSRGRDQRTRSSSGRRCVPRVGIGKWHIGCLGFSPSRRSRQQSGRTAPGCTVAFAHDGFRARVDSARDTAVDSGHCKDSLPCEFDHILGGNTCAAAQEPLVVTPADLHTCSTDGSAGGNTPWPKSSASTQELCIAGMGRVRRLASRFSGFESQEFRGDHSGALCWRAPCSTQGLNVDGRNLLRRNPLAVPALSACSHSSRCM